MAVYADARASGLDADRPALRRLLADARRGGVRRVVVRLARSTALLETILGALLATGRALGREDATPHTHQVKLIEWIIASAVSFPSPAGRGVG